MLKSVCPVAQRLIVYIVGSKRERGRLQVCEQRIEKRIGKLLRETDGNFRRSAWRDDMSRTSSKTGGACAKAMAGVKH
jgi:hypothetical protein